MDYTYIEIISIVTFIAIFMLLYVVILKISRWLKKHDGKWQLTILTKDALCYNYYIAYYHIIIIFFSSQK